MANHAQAIDRPAGRLGGVAFVDNRDWPLIFWIFVTNRLLLRSGLDGETLRGAKHVLLQMKQYCPENVMTFVHAA